MRGTGQVRGFAFSYNLLPWAVCSRPYRDHSYVKRETGFRPVFR